MKKMLYFWAAYLLFFALPFPCILYYSIGYPVDAVDRTSPAVALGWLGLSILLCGLLAAAYVHTLLRAPFRAQARTRAIQRAASAAAHAWCRRRIPGGCCGGGACGT